MRLFWPVQLLTWRYSILLWASAFSFSALWIAFRAFCSYSSLCFSIFSTTFFTPSRGTFWKGKLLHLSSIFFFKVSQTLWPVLIQGCMLNLLLKSRKIFKKPLDSCNLSVKDYLFWIDCFVSSQSWSWIFCGLTLMQTCSWASRALILLFSKSSSQRVCGRKRKCASVSVR